MPRFPMMRVIGSQAISTMFGFWLPVVMARDSSLLAVAGRRSGSARAASGRLPRAPVRLVAGGQLGAVVPPLRFQVQRHPGDAAHPVDEVAVLLDQGRRQGQ